uniref:Testin-2 (Trinotate prediction) n=1 Tax=Myxobolus squamalis TaxID=59785 RepID=A0A6B2FXQ4_MYXSQ
MGGFPEIVYEYCIDKGLSRSIEYPYTGKESRCRRRDLKSPYKLGSYVGLSSGDEENLLRALHFIGPISIVMDAMHDEFVFYESGILDILGCSSFDIDHAALAVGYNLEGTPYLLVKNSFGVNWGERGYFKIALFKNNMCGIATRPTFPIPII